MIVLELAAGLALLVAGGELLVRGAGGLGRAAGISPVVIGLTVVAGATSAPELAVSLDAALTGSPGLAVGNAVGSNTANVLLVLGLAALIRYQRVDKRLLRFDVPAALGAAVVLLVLSLDGTLGRPDGVLLIAGLGGYLLLAVLRGRHLAGGADDRARENPPRGRVLRDLALLTVGVGLLVLGARWLVGSASEIAAAVGFSDLVIGLTVVSIGTSLPEIVTSVIAALRGDRAMAVGNVVGSNLFNLGAVLGLTAAVVPVPVDEAATRFDIPVMIAATVALAAMLFTGSIISRAEGAALLAWFVAYTGYLVLDSEAHDALSAYSAVLLYFCLPVTVVTLLGLSTREFRSRR